MLSTAGNIQSVLQYAVDELAEVRCVDEELSISPFLSGSFSLYRANVLGKSILLAKDVASDDGSPKRLEALEKALGEPVAAIIPSVTPAERRALMAARQGFVTERGDLYLPQLALALKADAEKKRSEIRSFSPAQQQAFLYCLLGDGELTQEGLREKTGMSAAGASRALSSLADAGLIDYEIGGKTGRKRIYFVPDKPELFRKGRKLFGDPVRFIGKFSVAPGEGLPLSGLSALAAKSDLVAPTRTIVAAGPAAVVFKESSETDFEGAFLVQRLSYDPIPFAEGGVVDPFTMLATIDEDDERISISLREALGGFSWYTG
ncbi:MAG: winged helix-turn-helix domain-containing protein [Adlercreutzia sp.]|nr:winged helix-turn-helix domain-containing protein [Adlercreutzia sp.]